jgi:hypothetical protein
LCQINQAMTWAVCPGATPIFAAAKKGRYTLLELLLKHKARLNKTDEAGLRILLVWIAISCLISHL